MAVAYALARLGLELPEGAAQTLVGAVVDLVFALGALGVGVGRGRAHNRLG
jgi:hypothetical protein